MATQHPGLTKVGEYWHYALTINGQRSHGSTRARDLVTAKKVLEERRKELLQYQCGAPKVPTFAVIVAKWLKAHKAVHSKSHWDDVECVSRLWLLPAFGTRRVDHIRTGDVLQLRSKMLEAGRSPVTVNDALKNLKLLCRYALKTGYIRELPFRAEFLRVQKKPRPTIPAAKIHEFLAAVDSDPWNRNPHIPVMVRVMLGLGMREAEVLGMRWEWFDLEQRTYVVGKAKGKEARVLPVPDWVWSAVHNMPKPLLSEWVFPSNTGKPWRSHFCLRVIERACKTLELGKVTQHRLRATFASLHAAAGTPVTEIQGMLGHKNIATTMIYVETSLDAKRAAQDALSQKLGFAALA